ncbi:hypothetical protein ACWOAH_06755 [Vagococcus vulneris]|uniref:Uncharacterized protein n=1 Tax=Vagococcus vulneris TaxID=1977869 RepID=A0A429ZY78_9ENTE|nr:hypothetical protein [Vagococcus vulneris]RST98904.1 hypothetical protein CBF37_05910 [Vagococcus vulneris]
MEPDWQERLNKLQLENSDLYFKLQQSKSDEMKYQQELNRLQEILNHTDQSLQSATSGHDETKINLQEKINKLTFELQKKEQEILEKQERIQQLELEISGHDRYVAELKTDLDRAREDNQSQIYNLIQENDKLKNDLVSYQETELDANQKNQELQTETFDLKNKIQQLTLDKDTLAKEWDMKLRSIVQEKDQLRAEIEKSYDAANERHNEILQLRNRIIELEAALQQSNQEKVDMSRTYESRLSMLQADRDRLQMDVENKKRLYNQEKQNEVRQLTDRLTKQQTLVDKMMTTQQKTQDSWRSHYQQLEKNYQQVRSQSTRYEEELAHLQRENQALTMQLNTATNAVLPDFSSVVTSEAPLPNYDNLEPDTLTHSIVNNQSLETVSSDDYQELEAEVKKAQAQAKNYEEELSDLRQMNDDLMLKLTEVEEKVDAVPTAATTQPALVAHTVDSADAEYGDDDELVYDSDSDYDYDNDYDYDDYSYDDYSYDDYGYDDYDYDYEDDDELLEYDPDTAEDDIAELLEDTHSTKKVKVPKAEYEACEDQLDILTDRWKKAKLTSAKQLKFKKWAEPKVKKFSRFYRDLDDYVKPPKLFSRKYKMEADVYNRIKAYALLSRHIEEMSEK